MIRVAMIAAVLLLSACGGAKTDERDTAAGKILPGSISDAMLQTDRLQSEAPLAAPTVAAEDGDAAPKGAKRSGGADKAEADEKSAPDEAGAPATAPTAVATPAPPPAE